MGDVQVEALCHRLLADGGGQHALGTIDLVNFVAGLEFHAGHKGTVARLLQQGFTVTGGFPLGLAIVQKGLIPFAERLGLVQSLGSQIRHRLVLVQQVFYVFCISLFHGCILPLFFYHHAE